MGLSGGAAAYDGIAWKDYRDNSHHRRVVERLVQLIVDIAVDINTHAVIDAGKPPPRDSYSSFLKAAEVGLYTPEFAERIAAWTCERNIIAHECEDIDDRVVYQSIGDCLRTYREYLNCLREQL